MSSNDGGPGGGSGGNSGTTSSVAAKITHVKTTTLDAGSLSAVGGGIAIGGLSGGVSTIMTSGVSSGGIKVATGHGMATATAMGTPITLNTGQSTTAIRAIGSAGQSTQVRVVMPTGIMSPAMIKQLDSAGRTQITAIPAGSNARTVSNTSITVTRPVTQANYLPRAGVTATHMTGMGVGMATGQRLITPIRTTSASGNVGTTVTGLTAAGNFVRGTAISRNTSSPATTVITSGTSTTWMAANTTGQVQLIRAIPHQPRQRIITTQGISSATGATAVSGTVVATTAPQSIGAHTQQQGGQSTIQAISSQAIPHSQQQQTYVTTVLPPRQHPATLVYSSNMAAVTAQPLSQPQQFNTSVAAGGQRFAVATPLTAATGQIRPIPLGKPFSAAKLNTASISIRAPNIPQLTPSLTTGVSGASIVSATNSPRSTSVTGSTGNVIPTTNLSTTRIIQLQQQPGGTTQQIIGSGGRLAGNVMLQPIIVNTSGNSKFGMRPPVTMAAKVQPSLTITQLGIGKLPGVGGAGTIVGQQTVGASIQSISNAGMSSAMGGNNANSNVSAANLSTAAGAQLVNVSQATAAGQLLAAQNIVSSAGGGATVVPLAITTRGGPGGNILNGTITPIKNANSIAVGKMMAQAAQVAAEGSAGNNAPTNVYIHHTSAAQRSHTNATVSVAGSTASSAASTVLTSTGTPSFLPPGSTIYYESVPASSVQVSTGVLSLTTTTVTSSTMSQHQMTSSGGNLAISALPFVTHAANPTTTFTVVPSSGGRAIGQLQIPVSSAGGGTQIQALPVRFSAQLAAGSVATSTADVISVSQQSTPQLVQGTISSSGQQILIPASHQGGATTTITAQPGQHMVIPLQTSIKVTSAGSGGTAVVSNFLRKREAEGSPIRAAKNLGPALLSMGNTSVVSGGGGGSPAASSVGSSFSVVSSNSSSTSALTAEALAKKDHASGGGAATSTRSSRAESPASSDGSTTVSANSSPGVDQQIQDGNFVLNRMPHTSDSTHFNPINELYSNHHSVAIQHNLVGGTPSSSRNSSLDHQQMQTGGSSASTQRVNGGPIDCPPRKKSRRSTNDSQQSTQSQASLSLPPPSVGSMGHNIVTTDSNATMGNGSHLSGPIHEGNNAAAAGAYNNINHKTNNVPPTQAGNKENAKPVEFILRRPPKCTMLNTCKPSWKAANNHFQRYTDVKPRDERRPTVIEMANQANVLGKINGWKIYHLRSQMEDLCENESLAYDKLSAMLKQMESHSKNTEIERISDLLKGNMQRSKIIVDGINEAQNQIMKIFDHKSHISDIIHRCASKRNFIKREKF